MQNLTNTPAKFKPHGRTRKFHRPPLWRMLMRRHRCSPAIAKAIADMMKLEKTVAWR
jgi:hypothetical protein